MIIKTTTTYYADDGRKFDHERDCREYENKFYLNKWAKVPKVKIESNIFGGDYYDGEYYIVVCRSMGDVMNVNAYLGYLNEEKREYIKLTETDEKIIINLWPERCGASRIKGTAINEIEKLVKIMLVDEPKCGVE